MTTYFVKVYRTDGRKSEHSEVMDLDVEEGVLVLRSEKSSRIFPMHTVDEVITTIEGEAS